MPRQELARFLRDRRNALRPPEPGTDRRTPGLRREEVAERAHMSVDYYTRLEQARGPRPSPTILEGLSQAFGLTQAERSHLFRLAGALAPPGRNVVRTVRPHVAAMLERLPGTAAIVTDASYDVVARTPLAEALLGGGTNLARRRFLGEEQAYESSSAEEFGYVVVAACAAPPTATRTTRGCPPCSPTCTPAATSSGGSGGRGRCTPRDTAPRPSATRGQARCT